jgi:phosphoribosylformylglycinamidine synthase
VFAPGTVIISAAGEVSDVKKVVSPVLQPQKSTLYYIDFSGDSLKLGGSAFAQSLNKLGKEVATVTDAAQFAKTFNAVQKLVNDKALLAAHDISAGGLITTLLEMTFANVNGGISLDLDAFAALGETDIIKILFSENPALVVQVADAKRAKVEQVLSKAGARFIAIGTPADERTLTISHDGSEQMLFIDHLRDVWFRSSYLLDAVQSGEKCAAMRFENYKKQPIRYRLPAKFDGSLASRGLTRKHGKNGVRAAIIREKGVNGDREMAYSLYLAGFDVKDVHMTDLMTGRETLEDVNMIVFCGGFSNSDVLGSAKGWAGGFLWNERAKASLEAFFKRDDTLSLGICNGCQLMIELNLINPEHEHKTKMEHNISHKFESQFLGLTIPENNSVMLGSLSGTKLGVWVAHGEGKFNLPEKADKYNIVARYNYASYPGNPNGSRGAVAALASQDGRHLAMMPHPERAIFPWQCGYYPATRRFDDVTPWIDAFVNARKWIEQKTK